jgi:hypothetical protein
MGFYLNLLMDNVRLVHDTSVTRYMSRCSGSVKGMYSWGSAIPLLEPHHQAMQFAKSTGATVVGITDGPSSPFVGVADINLFAKSDMVSFLDSLVAPMSLINALIVSIGFHKQESLSDTFRSLENIWSEYEVYEKLDG